VSLCRAVSVAQQKPGS